MVEFLEGLVNSLPSVATLGLVGGAIFSVVKWYDVRNRELKQRRWSDYNDQLSLVGGRYPSGRNVNFFEWTPALFQLLEFTEYTFITVSTLETVLKSEDLALAPYKEQLGAKIEVVLEHLRSQKTFKKQSARFRALSLKSNSL